MAHYFGNRTQLNLIEFKRALSRIFSISLNSQNIYIFVGEGNIQIMAYFLLAIAILVC